MSQPHSDPVARPRVCPWCASTVTFAARRCPLCGMSIGEEIRASLVQPAAATAEPSAPIVRSPRTAAVVLLAATALLLCAILLYLAHVMPR